MAQNLIGYAQRYYTLHKRYDGLSLLLYFPVHPAVGVVLAVGVVVALLGTPELIAREKHWRPLRQQERGEHVSHLAFAQPIDVGVVCRAFHAAIPRSVAGASIFVAFTVRVVVLLVVRDQIAQREAIVCGA